MPIYEYDCDCGRQAEAFRAVADRRDSPLCCGKSMRLLISAPIVHGDLPGYQSPVTGKWIEGRTARRDDLARNNCRPWEGKDAEVKEAQRQLAHEERQSDARLEATAQSAYSQLSPEKRKILSDSGPVD